MSNKKKCPVCEEYDKRMKMLNEGEVVLEINLFEYLNSVLKEAEDFQKEYNQEVSEDYIEGYKQACDNIVSSLIFEYLNLGIEEEYENYENSEYNS